MRNIQKYCRGAFFSLCALIWLTSLTAFGAPLSSTSESNKKWDYLRGRLGIGFTSQVAFSGESAVPSLSAKYYMSRSLAVALNTSFDTRENNSTLTIGGKVFNNVFAEPNMVFYLGGGLAYLSRHGSFLQGSLFLGSEFFIPQLPSLGLSFEAGIRGDNTSGSFAIRTTGDSFLTGGMHFYF